MEGACASHFAKPVTSKQLAELCDTAVPSNTKLTTEWGIRLWKEWASSRGATSAPSQTTSEEKAENVLPVTTPLIDLPPKDLTYWLGKFVLEVRKKNGDKYPPKTLYALVCYFKWFFVRNGVYSVNPLDPSDAPLVNFELY